MPPVRESYLLLRPLTLLVPTILVLALSGCGQERADTALEGEADRVDLLDAPTIHSIGEGSILTYEPGKPVEIKILGNNLYDPELSWNISIAGIAPLQSGVDYMLRKDPQALEKIRTSSMGEDNLAIVLTPAYATRIRSGDPLTLTVQLTDNRLSRRYQNVRMAITTIESELSALRSLRAKVLAWSLSARMGAEAASTASQQTEGGAAADAAPPEAMPTSQAAMHLTFAKEMAPHIETLSKLHEATVEGQAMVNAIMENLRHLDPTDEVFDTTFSDLEGNLTRLRSIYKNFVRTHVGVAPVVASSSRHFVLFSADDYRQRFLGSTVPLNEIRAFPLPDDQVRKLFGPVVADEFFVVAISISNYSEVDRLIDTGMIKASGRALICPPEGSSLITPVFNYSVPIEMVPQSTEQVYTLVSDTKPHQTREWFFRSLEFVGALATAAATGFQANLDLVKSIGLFSGVAVPGAKALWPDDVPGYMRNIIAFGMPDLVKINGKSTVGHRVLFFSKEKLQLMVSDPLQFQYRPGKGLEHPQQYVVQLAFENLMVSFDNITSPTKGTVEERMASIRQELNALIAEERQVAGAWTGNTGDAYARQLRWEDWLELAQWFSLAATAGPSQALDDNQIQLAKDLLAAWRQIHGGLAPPVVKDRLTNHERIGIAALERDLKAIENAQAGIAAGQSARIFASRVENAEGVAALARSMIDYQHQAAALLVEIHQRGLVTSLLKGADRDTAAYTYNALRERLDRLVAASKGISAIITLPAVPPELPIAPPPARRP
jgi:hypothetical protein